MKNQFKAILSMGCACIFLLQQIHANEKINNKNGLKYQSKGFSCHISEDGVVHDIKIQDFSIVKISRIYSSPFYQNSKEKDLRIFQKERTNSVKVKSDGEYKKSVFIEGTLGNSTNKNLAKYTEKILLTPTKITFEYQVVTTKQLHLFSFNPFLSLNYALISTYRNHGYVTVDNKNNKSFSQFPEIYQRANSLCKKNLKSLRILFDNWHIVVKATDSKSKLRLSDTRGNGGNFFRFDVMPFIPYKKEAINYPQGSVFKWSYSIILEKNKPKRKK